MQYDVVTKQSLLYDFYGELLTKRQREVMELYNEENLSLGEIAEEFGISRQGVHDALHKAQKALEEYEQKLGLVERFRATQDAIHSISEEIDAAIVMASAGEPGNGAKAGEPGNGASAGEPSNGAKVTASGSKNRTDSTVAGKLRQIRSEIEQLEI